ncbi:hypothetical protein MLD38_034869 [Melastoma candidum]|uniref:Uncharacterized protein n=3 Tax=Melastoma candidum TaxID=119954 RepID=A0ACB9MDG7_9MYRT|nr:hypothetical protein MLD38_034865 [Melastoma candidum]KAI4321498.1 hypothetical protein MLD38_034868 [Melastoma candidum]KAI4321499.1 hypothetical protein MLD38_034869 [Melastoma candidum]
MKLAFVAFVLICLLLGSSFFETAEASSSFCSSKCSVRCSRTRKRDRCLKYCGICCARCNCVPPGYYGNKDRCPCYRDLKNSKGTPKCP